MFRVGFVNFFLFIVTPSMALIFSRLSPGSEPHDSSPNLNTLRGSVHALLPGLAKVFSAVQQSTESGKPRAHVLRDIANLTCRRELSC
jgi:hypothetical protein